MQGTGVSAGDRGQCGGRGSVGVGRQCGGRQTVRGTAVSAGDRGQSGDGGQCGGQWTVGDGGQCGGRRSVGGWGSVRGTGVTAGDDGQWGSVRGDDGQCGGRGGQCRGEGWGLGGGLGQSTWLLRPPQPWQGCCTKWAHTELQVLPKIVPAQGVLGAGPAVSPTWSWPRAQVCPGVTLLPLPCPAPLCKDP